ncbi:pentapeptide repeat-containing protein [Nitrosomonas ureae]|uniref:Uncharacterized protein YjbI with pentapeptide repeats n=1 Tax=Nitrosomonas ureae TaxID=44577 RepID=A0A2T5I7A5_9PROT|nr:pentapeptide repeat-containing protein [Nitrosomonas ureae]PTQ79703.1 uncharacterized protein YjbI with pentapeptide repeats [Nitrosomonas ureae]
MNFLYKRGFIILLVVMIEILLLIFLEEKWRCYLLILNLNHNSSWLGPVLTMFLASPVAFFIWFYRNNDKKIDQQHAEENIRQLDFHKIEEWATISENEGRLKLSKNNYSSPALQIAAIYQLVPYLQGSYGLRFVRPTMEIYKSLLANWKEAEQLNNLEESLEIKKNIPGHISAIHSIFCDEMINFARKENIIKNYNNGLEKKWIPFKNIKLNCIELSGLDLTNINLSGASFKFGNINGCNFERTIIFKADFSGSVLTLSEFSNALMDKVNFNNIIVKGSNFKMSQFLKNSDFSNANLRHANLSDADLSHCIFGRGKRISRNRSHQISTTAPSTFNYNSTPFKRISNTFKFANLININLSNTKLSNSLFINSELSNADFSGAKLYKSVFTEFNLGALRFTQDDFNRWIHEEEVIFDNCYVFDNIVHIDFNIFKKANILIKTTE